MKASSEPLETITGKLLSERGLTLAVAESCTGGLLSNLLTDVPGSSAYFLGGVVAYSNRAKEEILGVSHETLLGHGAVSEETAREMARGARKLFGSDLALAITGIAGPTGGTPQKPVGLVYISLSSAEGEFCHRHLWAGERLENKLLSAQAALQMLIDYLAQARVWSKSGDPP
ncbi:MAG: CinA family protein [Anaerolineae bacterium]